MDSFGNLLFRYRGYLPVPFFVLLGWVVAYQPPAPQGDGAAAAWEAVGLAVTAIGQVMRVLVAGFVPGGSSGRNTKSQAAEALNTEGLYSLVRHPLYVANFILALGVTLLAREWWLIVVYTAFFWLYYHRIMAAEEAFLRGKFGASHESWVARTPRFIPRPWGWRPPTRAFSVRVAIRREYPTLASLVLSIAVLKVLSGLAVTGQFNWDPFWLWTCLVVQVVFVPVIYLIRHTRVLNRPDSESTDG